jgi:Kef-type K+ transport system membrane component KefB
MRLAPTAGLVALIQIVAMVGLGYLVGLLMGWTPWECLVTNAMVSISGVVIVAKAFEEVPVESRVRELVFGVVMCEDVIAILMLAVLITIANGGAVSLYAFTIDAGLLSLFIVVMIAAPSPDSATSEPARRFDQLRPEYLAINPDGVVLTLVHDGQPAASYMHGASVVIDGGQTIA